MEPPFLEKRKSDVANENKRTKKQKVSASSKATETLDVMKTEVKKIMQSLRNKLDQQASADLTDFIRDKLEILEKDTKQMVGVFGKTGAGKSSLINAILDETDLLPSGGQGACTSVMIRVEANLTNDKCIAEIEFIPKQVIKYVTSVLSHKMFGCGAIKNGTLICTDRLC
ncbi:hypothetical protein DPEC_G00303500 [Dallia pectoralis]|uniref:Uncharacterized protein n=1 Tax=Dallia pectoralis TaxID=75939 RepID=A0ACC2FDB2_DALPE|nr:hypothetical protein DPEC_G00303500 [Dallia pectoralis]